MICPKCERQVGALQECPVCKVATRAPDPEPVNRRPRRRSGTPGRWLRRLAVAALGIGILLSLVCWPLAVPADAAGEASLALLSGRWAEYTARKDQHAARFEISDRELSGLAAARAPEVPAVFQFTDTVTVWFPMRRPLPATLRIEFAPRLTTAGRLELRVRSVRLGLLPLPAGMAEAQLAPKLAPLETLLRGSKYLTVEPGRLLIEADPARRTDPASSPFKENRHD